MSKRQPEAGTLARRSASIMLACLLAGCAATAEQRDRELHDAMNPDLLSSTDPRGADESEPDSGFTGSDGPTLDDFSLKNVQKSWKKLTGRGPNKKLARQLYDEAEAEYRRAAEMDPGPLREELFLSAGKKFASAAEYWPESSYERDALFMAGESYFFADYYWDATRYYERLIKAHPNNCHLDTVDQRRFAIARFWLEINKPNPEPFYYVNFFDESRPWRDSRGHGMRQYDKIRLDDPTGNLADDATLAIANAHFQAARYLKADEYYTDLRRSYPRSEHQFSAHFLGLKAKLESYLGPDYSSVALDEAEKLIRQMRRQFPEDAAREKEFLDRSAAEIRYRKAQKLDYFARYYDKRGEHRAASYYYQQVARDYGDTSFAANASQRLAKIEHLPPVPPQRLPWLVKMFPQSDKVKPILNAAKLPDGAQRSVSDEGEVQQASGEE